MAYDYESSLCPEAELPLIEDEVVGNQTFAAGYTPTKTGEWIVPMLVTIETK